MIRDHKNTIYRMLSFIINTFQELPNDYITKPFNPNELFQKIVKFNLKSSTRNDKIYFKEDKSGNVTKNIFNVD